MAPLTQRYDLLQHQQVHFYRISGREGGLRARWHRRQCILGSPWRRSGAGSPWRLRVQLGHDAVAYPDLVGGSLGEDPVIGTGASRRRDGSGEGPDNLDGSLRHAAAARL